jgi:hypothetical protein
MPCSRSPRHAQLAGQRHIACIGREQPRARQRGKVAPAGPGIRPVSGLCRRQQRSTGSWLAMTFSSGPDRNRPGPPAPARAALDLIPCTPPRLPSGPARRGHHAARRARRPADGGLRAERRGELPSGQAVGCRPDHRHRPWPAYQRLGRHSPSRWTGCSARSSGCPPRAERPQTLWTPVISAPKTSFSVPPIAFPPTWSITSPQSVRREISH